ncbi:MAG TPA: hypothetical protein VF598_03970 [Hymenobacter sp.]|jgi:asparagine N-glycosylation enzyme membrane subunit Stt3
MLPRLIDTRFPIVELSAALLAGVSSFVELHIWSPAYTYFMLLFLVIVDVTVNNHVKGQRHRPKIMLLILLAYTLVLAFANAFGKHEVGLIWLPQVVLAPFVVGHLRRLIKNFGKLSLMEEDTAALLSTNLSSRQQALLAEKPAVELAPTTPVVADEAVLAQ